MNWLPVNSSNLAAIAFQHGTLYVQFKRGHVYTYTGPGIREKFDKLYEIAERRRKFGGLWSAGQYFNRHIRDKYDAEKL